ncbi:microcephalin [Calliopsis andreniformis]|uniref:microcephalin n=1 Tax=Calliopsis andreniformis TaxID=337506 RepID=UPI003FCDBFB8
MSPSKRKLGVENITDDSISLKHQRSSLQVNLSVSNLSDSGNGSLRQTNNTAHNTINIDTSSRSNRLSRSKRASTSKHEQSIPLKDVSVVVERINNENEILHKSCEELKQAILNKTKEMFDIQNEFSLKTLSILGTKHLGQQNKTIDADQSIGITPKEKNGNKSVKEQSKYRLRKRRLFNMNHSKRSSIGSSSFHSARSQNSSTILAGSSKKPENFNLSSTASNASENESEFMAVPIGCSTMLSDEIIDVEHVSSSDSEKSLEKEQSFLGTHTRKDVVSMEITDMRGGFIRSDDQDAQTTRNSMNTTRTSLNVNTSMDALNNSKSLKRKSSRNEEEINQASEEVQESINTVRTSLQMNTSLDTSNRLCLQKSSMSVSHNASKKTGTREGNLTNNVATRNSRDQSMRITGTSMRKDQSTDSSNKSKTSASKTSEGQSYVEATPYPACRSVLLRSQLRQTALANTLAARDLQNNKNKSVECVDPVNEQEEVANETVILDNSSLCKAGTSKQASVIINESTEESQLEDNENKKDCTSKKKFKKKLLPLNENSQLVTFSPMEEERILPKCPTFLKRRKKAKKQLQKTKFNNGRSVSSVEHIEAENSRQSLLLEDDHIFRDKKKQNTKKPKKIISKKILVKKIVNEDILKTLEENRENVRKTQMEACVSSRNSTNDFQSTSRLSATQLSKKQGQRIVIVATGLSNDDKNMVKIVVKTLGSAKIESSVTKRTTHVVTTGVRTINLLHGIIRGCWLVSLEWVLKSLENNAWLNPEKYEMKHFSKAVLENRKDRQLFGKAYVPELFTACGYIYVEGDTIPPCVILKDLVKAAGGFITEKPEAAKIVIGSGGLKENWVLDCITTGELQAFNQYRR